MMFGTNQFHSCWLILALAGVSGQAAETRFSELHRAVTAGDTNRAREILDARPELARSTNAEALNVFVFAVSRRSNNMARLFIAHGANVAAACAFTSPALHNAAMNRAGEGVQALIEHGAPADGRDQAEATPLHYLARHIRSADAGPLPGGIVDLLVANGADVNVRDRAGETPLGLAAAGGDIPLALALLRHGAQAHSTNNQGWTPIFSATLSRQTNMAELLEKHGAVLPKAWFAVNPQDIDPDSLRMTALARSTELQFRLTDRKRLELRELTRRTVSGQLDILVDGERIRTLLPTGELNLDELKFELNSAKTARQVFRFLKGLPQE